jgi:hypothetical protein
MTSLRTLPRLIWIPRTLGILFIGFLGIFAVDVFGEGLGAVETIQALLIHLIPALIVACAFGIAWRWERVGGLLFLGLGVLYLVLSWGRFHWSAYAVIAGPALLIGSLFLVCSWNRRTPAHSGTSN